MARPITSQERLAIIFGVLLLWAGSTAALVWYGKRTHDNGVKVAQVEVSQRLAQIATCKRGNERTVAENVSSLADWRFFSSTARLLKATLTHRPPGQAAPTSEQISKTHHFIGGLEADARDKVWHHLIENCEYAIDHPKTFVLPPAVPFSRTGHHHTPPKGAMHIARGE